MKQRKKTLLTDKHKEIIISTYKKNKRFRRTDLAIQLGLPSMTVINFLCKYLKDDNGGFVNTSICPIMGYKINS